MILSKTAVTPPTEIYPGAIDHGNGRVTFTLYAPGKQSVYLAGNFNHWHSSADLMQQATRSGWWWLEKQLKPGRHAYQFVVEPGPITICDPYARALAEEAECDPPRAIVEVGREPYAWRHDTWNYLPFKDLIIYELHIGDFSPEGTFQGVINRLDYLQDLGINAIELMPIYEFRGQQHAWGYNPAYFFTVEKSYGRPDDLRRLIDEAHGRGIAVILDIVLAHTAHVHSFNKLYPIRDSPWYGQGLGKANEFGFPALDYTKEPTQAFVRAVQAYWLAEFHVDGFRYDYLHGVGFREDMGVPFLIQTAREIRPNAHLIGEYGPECAEEVNACDLNGAWHIRTGYALKALLGEGEYGEFNWDDFAGAVSVLDPAAEGYNRASQMINFMESHDEERVIHELGVMGISDGSAYHKSALGATILFTMPGQPMLYHGQEWGEGTKKTLEPNPIHWDQLETADGRRLFEHYRRLCRLRRDHPALRSGNFALTALHPRQKALVYHRWDNRDDEVVVATNFQRSPQTVMVPFPYGGRWREVLSEQEVEVDDQIELNLAPSSAQVYIPVK